MSATRAEKWALRVISAAARAGVDLPDDATSGGMQTLAIVGMQAILRASFTDLEPLLDEMLECVTIKPDKDNHMIVRKLIDDDIEEMRTLIELRRAILELHLGFSLAGKQ